MEEIREASLAFYEGGPVELTQLAKTLFKKMDVDGNGWISIKEFENFLQSNGYLYDHNIFYKIDRDENKFLDFEEVKVFLYMVQTRYVVCDGCRSLMNSTYFTCSDCIFHGNGAGYDLCCACYRSKKFGQGHGPFLDNFSTLLTIREQLRQRQLEQQQQPQVLQQSQIKKRWITKDDLQQWKEAFKLGQAIGELGNTIASQGECNIM